MLLAVGRRIKDAGKREIMERCCKIIIIDDEFIMRQGMKHMLDWEEEGFQIVGEATNGQEGLELIEKLNPDIVIADIVMPVLDGIEFSSIIHQKYPNLQLIVLSSYDKFEYVKATLMNGAADYILKPTLNPEVLLKTLNRVVRKIPGMNLAKGSRVSPAARIERLFSGYQEHLDESMYAEVFPHTLFRIVGTNLKRMCEGKKEYMAWVEESMTSFFDEKKDYVSIPLFIDEEYLCFVLNFRIKDEKAVLADIETYAAKMLSIQRQAFFVVSESFSDMQEMKSYYQKGILPFVNQRFYYPGRSLLTASRKTEQEKEERFAFEKYSGYMLHARFEEALDMFMEYVRYICSIRMDEYKMKNLAKNLLYTYLIEVESGGLSGEELRDQYFAMVDGAEDVDSFLDMMAKVREEIGRLGDEKAGREDAKIAAIKSYINEHCAENLSLARLADKFGFSYHYLSFYFNRQTKEGFSEYLNRIRIEKACGLLEHSESSISEISSQTGYSDHAYFCRIFKRITGETPSGYRRLHKI